MSQIRIGFNPLGGEEVCPAESTDEARNALIPCFNPLGGEEVCPAADLLHIAMSKRNVFQSPGRGRGLSGNLPNFFIEDAGSIVSIPWAGKRSVRRGMGKTEADCASIVSIPWAGKRSVRPRSSPRASGIAGLFQSPGRGRGLSGQRWGS